MIAAAITNWISFTGTTEIEHENSLVHWNLWPWDDMTLAWERSPLAHIANAKTPALIVHGAADTRVPDRPVAGALPGPAAPRRARPSWSCTRARVTGSARTSTGSTSSTASSAGSTPTSKPRASTGCSQPEAQPRLLRYTLTIAATSSGTVSGSGSGACARLCSSRAWIRRLIRREVWLPSRQARSSRSSEVLRARPRANATAPVAHHHAARS